MCGGDIRVVVVKSLGRGSVPYPRRGVLISVVGFVSYESRCYSCGNSCGDQCGFVQIVSSGDPSYYFLVDSRW